MFDLSTPEGLQAAQEFAAQRAQKTAVAPVITESKPEQKTDIAPKDVLTEKEAISIVQSWVAQDTEVELSDRRTFEEMVEDLREAAENRTSEIPVSRFAEIVKQYAPDAPRRNETPRKDKPNYPSYPAELAPLVESGVASFADGYWLVDRCERCGQFKNKCCGLVFPVPAVRQDEKTLTSYGRQALGLDPIKPPKPPKTLEEIRQDVIRNLDKNPWWNNFRGVDELQGNGTVKMYIENFLPEGTTLICGLPKEGKSFLALSVAKALTSGKPLFGRLGFEVPEPVPVLYLAAESGDGALKLRCEKMGITKDKTQFICRTLSQGLMYGLDDPNIEALVKDMRPVVILETLIRFNDGTDEDSSTENRKLAENLFRLIAWGARAVIGIHHSRKDLNKANPTKEAAVRGSGDGLAMVDCVWLVMQDEKLFRGGKGPNEVDLVGWGRDFNPVPMRLALTGVAPKDLPKTAILFAPGIISNLDVERDLKWVDKGIVFKQGQHSAESLKETIERLVTESPTITLSKLCETVDQKEWKVRKVLKQLGYSRGQGDNSTTRWVKNPG